MDSERPILILSASAGAGHMVAARAVAESLATLAPAARVEVVDVLQLSNTFFRRLYAQGYLGLVNHAPTAMGMLYEAMDKSTPAWRDKARIAFQNLNVGRIRTELIARRPRLIINTHFLPAEIVAQLRRCGKLDCPQVTVTTDFETHRMWAQSPTERYYTATEEGKAYLASWGAEAARILVTGIPVRAAFSKPLDRIALRRAQGLDERKSVVLLLCGGFGVGPTELLLRELVAMDEPHAQIVAVAGRNDQLRARLEALPHDHSRRVRVVGFTDTMHEWMRSADLVVTKPGGLTVSEALVCGLPLVVVNPIPGQEARNSDYLLEHGAAIKVNNTRLLGFRVARLLADGPRLAALRAAAEQLARPTAACAIAADALALVS